MSVRSYLLQDGLIIGSIIVCRHAYYGVTANALDSPTIFTLKTSIRNAYMSIHFYRLMATSFLLTLDLFIIFLYFAGY